MLLDLKNRGSDDLSFDLGGHYIKKTFILEKFRESKFDGILGNLGDLNGFSDLGHLGDLDGLSLD